MIGASVVCIVVGLSLGQGVGGDTRGGASRPESLSPATEAPGPYHLVFAHGGVAGGAELLMTTYSSAGNTVTVPLYLTGGLALDASGGFNLTRTFGLGLGGSLHFEAGGVPVQDAAVDLIFHLIKPNKMTNFGAGLAFRSSSNPLINMSSPGFHLQYQENVTTWKGFGVLVGVWAGYFFPPNGFSASIGLDLGVSYNLH